RVPAVRGADSSHRARIADLLRDVSVRPRFSEWNRPQRVPDLALKGRAVDVQLHHELRPPSRKILVQLALGFYQDRMTVVARLDAQLNAFRPVVFPQDAGEPFVRCNQCERAYRRAHRGMHVTLWGWWMGLDHCSVS